jgi:hypothetical protein
LDADLRHVLVNHHAGFALEEVAEIGFVQIHRRRRLPGLKPIYKYMGKIRDPDRKIRAMRKAGSPPTSRLSNCGLRVPRGRREELGCANLWFRLQRPPFRGRLFLSQHLLRVAE